MDPNTQRPINLTPEQEKQVSRWDNDGNGIADNDDELIKKLPKGAQGVASSVIRTFSPKLKNEPLLDPNKAEETKVQNRRVLAWGFVAFIAIWGYIFYKIFLSGGPIKWN